MSAVREASAADIIARDLLADIVTRTAVRPIGKNRSGAKRKRRGVHGTRAPPKRRAPPSVLGRVTVLARPRQLDVLPMTDALVVPAETEMRVMHCAFAQALKKVHPPPADTVGAASVFVPVATVDMDNEQLRWGMDAPLCSAGGLCVATRLTNAPGPLHAYTPPSGDNSSDLCLLCLRLHVEMINKASLTISEATSSAVLHPPFTNLMNCPGGYHDWAMGVTPNHQRLFDRQCSIVGSCPNLTVKYSPLDKTWWVDQSEIIWTPDFR